MKNITVIAHRCGPMNYPEQTVAAAAEAYACGADLIEIDLRFAKDGNIVISHDTNTSRVFGKNYNIADISGTFYYNLYRSGKDTAFRGHLIDDFLKDRTFPLLFHIKEGGEEKIGKIINQVHMYDVQPRTAYGVHSVEDAEIAKRLDPTAELLAFMPSVDDLDAYAETEVDYIRLWEDWVTKDRIDAIHKAGKKVWVMVGGCNGRDAGEIDDKSLAKLLKEDIDGILINDVRKVK